MKQILPFFFLISVLSQSFSQPKAAGVQKLPLDASLTWTNPQFSPTGRSVFLTTVSFNGIWAYSLQSNSLRQITNDPKSGFGFSVSSDESQIAYRRTLVQAGSKRRVHEIVVKRLDTGSSTVVASGPDLSAPVFSQSNVVYSVRKETQNLALIRPSEDARILGIEDTKIAMIKNGRKILFDPLGNGSYIWPSLSPDKSLIVAYDMDRGAFVSDLAGNVRSRLGRIDSPTWTRTGRWIVCVEEKDDGHRILSSDLVSISPDGRRRGQITNTPGVIELNPQCSPTENKIVYQTQNGEIFLMRYTE